MPAMDVEDSSPHPFHVLHLLSSSRSPSFPLSPHACVPGELQMFRVPVTSMEALTSRIPQMSHFLPQPCSPSSPLSSPLLLSAPPAGVQGSCHRRGGAVLPTAGLLREEPRAQVLQVRAGLRRGQPRDARGHGPQRAHLQGAVRVSLWWGGAKRGGCLSE